MITTVCNVHVTDDGIDAFKAASLENARHSLREPGIARFDVIQQADDPTRFVLVEVYRTPEAPAAHKETAHYLRWRDAVAPMMASPLTTPTYWSMPMFGGVVVDRKKSSVLLENQPI